MAGSLTDKHNAQKYAPDRVYDEVWLNSTYTVFILRHRESGWHYPDTAQPVLMTWLSIKRNDCMARPDWRDFQWIKNQLVGDENEAVELYPAESRLVDGANQYHLWVVEDTAFKFPFGFDTRLVKEKCFFGETQRKFPENKKPHDLGEQHRRIQEHKDNIDQQTKI